MLASSTGYFATVQQRQSELAQLQGVWTSLGGKRPAELMIAGNLFTIKFLDGALYMGTFEIDLDETPRTMDMRVDEGPIKHRGNIALCIYELNGDRLRWSPGQPGSDERPAGFCDEDDPNGLCLLFRREVPRRREG